MSHRSCFVTVGIELNQFYFGRFPYFPLGPRRSLGLPWVGCMLDECAVRHTVAELGLLGARVGEDWEDDCCIALLVDFASALVQLLSWDHRGVIRVGNRAASADKSCDAVGLMVINGLLMSWVLDVLCFGWSYRLICEPSSQCLVSRLHFWNS